jgi:ABC-type lipoprotein export system ATPase subunit
MNSKLLEVREVHRGYPMGREMVHVLRGVSLTVAPGDFVVITGSSGSGKSTFLHILGALDVPDRGSVLFNGADLFRLAEQERRNYRNKKVGFVFQFYHLLPELTVLENVMLPHLIGNSWSSWWPVRREARRQAEALVERVGLSSRIMHRPRELSGGERQRVAIARALISKPTLLLADEPTGNLDEKIGSEVLQLLDELHQSGQTIIMVTHDPKVASHAHRCMHLGQGVLQKTAEPSGPGNAAQLEAREVVS